MYFVSWKKWSGDYSEEVTPVPISNTEVKLFSADGSRGFASARVGRCQALNKVSYGGLAQLGEHLPYKQGVAGSSPASSTILESRPSSIGRATDL